MNKMKRLILWIYAGLVLVFGILRVPVYARWGSTGMLAEVKYTWLWQVTDKGQTINGFTPYHEIDMKRLLLTLLVLSLITGALYLSFKDQEVADNTRENGGLK